MNSRAKEPESIRSEPWVRRAAVRGGTARGASARATHSGGYGSFHRRLAQRQTNRSSPSWAFLPELGRAFGLGRFSPHHHNCSGPTRRTLSCEALSVTE